MHLPIWWPREAAEHFGNRLHTLIGRENVFRISPTVPARRLALDTTTDVGPLKGLGFTEARQQVNALRDVFFTPPAEPFVRPA